jgi:uncharacterized protein YraI
LELSPAGVLSGTPSAAGSFTFTVTATDSATPTANTGAQAYTVVIAPQAGVTLTLTAPPLPGGTQNTAYPATNIVATGGTGPYTYAITGGTQPTGLELSPAGVLSGTPTAAGSFTFTVTATDSATPTANTGAQAYTVVIAPQAGVTLTLTAPPLPGGTQNTAYPATNIVATGGTGPYTYAITGGTQPTGLELSPAGVLSGTPSAAGSFTFTVTATDSATPTANTGAQAYTVVIAPQAGVTLTLTAPPLPGGTQNTAYPTTNIVATGGTGPYTYAITGGTQPTGLSLSPAGVLSGTPSAAGSFTFTVTATDSATPTANTGAQAYTVVIAPQIVASNPVLSPTTLPNGTQNTAYNQTLTATGGTAPYFFAVSVGSLPTGLTLNTSGAITGTPTTPGTFNFTVSATDTSTRIGTQAYTIIIGGTGSISISPASLPTGTVNTAYSTTITATGGSGGYVFSLSAGSLPGGLTLNGSGQLSGTPNGSGSFTFTVLVTDSSSRTASQSYILTINAASFLPTSTPISTLFAPTPAPLPTAVPLTGDVSTNIRALAVRTGPFLGASLITIIRPGTPYTIIARSAPEGSVVWYLVTVGNRQGWVSGRFLTPGFDVNLVPVQGSIFDQIDGAQPTGLTATTRTVLNIRQRPSQRTPRIGQIPVGATVEILGRTIVDARGQTFWVHIRYNGGTGWVLGRWLFMPGDLRRVPIR